MDHLYICDRKGQERGLGSKVKSARQDGFSASPAEIQQDGEVSTDGKGTDPRRDEKEPQGRKGWRHVALSGTSRRKEPRQTDFHEALMGLRGWPSN